MEKITQKKHIKSKIFAVVLSMFILGLLVISGPAQAFILGLSVADDTVTKGDNAVFTASVDIKSGERLPIDKLKLVIDNNIVCVFDVNGNVIGECEGIDINLISNSVSGEYGYGYGNYGYGYGYNFGYGYGYSNGELVYEIIVDSDNYSIGNHNALLRALINNKIFESDDVNFTINSVSRGSSGGACRTDWVSEEWSECINGIQIRKVLKEDIFCSECGKKIPAP